MKVHPVQQALKVEAAAVVNIKKRNHLCKNLIVTHEYNNLYNNTYGMPITLLLFPVLTILLINIQLLPAQDLPDNSVEVDINGYFDNFAVDIVYPSISANYKLDEKTSVNGRYLVDVITSASMKSHYDSVYSTVSAKKNIDAYTSATTKKHGGEDQFPDELRHEFALGITRMLGAISVSVNNIYSTEHDYTSETIAANTSIPFFLKNTIVNLGLTKRWDKVRPQIRTWKADKDVLNLDFGLTQILSRALLAQAEVSYSYMNGCLIDPYQVVPVFDTVNMAVKYYESVYPGSRTRWAGGLRCIWGVKDNVSLQLGYRYYSDDWDIRSHTIDGLYQQSYLDDNLILGFGCRVYFQTQASFFKDRYYNLDKYIGVDSKLNGQFSNELQLKCDVNGSLLSFINNDRINLISRINLYFRKTDSPDWFSRYDKLYALIFSFGCKILF